MGWLIACAVILALALLPLGISFRYHSGGASLKLIAGPVRISLFPRRKEEEKKEKAPKEKKPKSSGHVAKEKEEEHSGGSWKDFLPLVRVGLGFLNGLRRKVRVRYLQLKLTMAAEDPCDLAVNYGRANAALGNLLPRLERVLVIKKRDVEVACDFTASQTQVVARVDATILLGRLLALLVRYGVRALKEYFKMNNKRKGGASQ